jgi:S1-C subfamily serine protease
LQLTIAAKVVGNDPWTDLAVVRLAGRDVYCGPFGTPESRQPAN